MRGGGDPELGWAPAKEEGASEDIAVWEQDSTDGTT